MMNLVKGASIEKVIDFNFLNDIVYECVHDGRTFAVESLAVKVGVQLGVKVLVHVSIAAVLFALLNIGFGSLSFPLCQRLDGWCLDGS